MKKVKILRYEAGAFSFEEDLVVQERPTNIFINGAYYVSVMASAGGLDDLARGYLFSEGLIGDPAEAEAVEVEGHDIRVRLKGPVQPPPVRARSSGFGLGSVSLSDLSGETLNISPPASPRPGLDPGRLTGAMAEFELLSDMFRQTGAAHSARIVTDEEAFFAEDVGRHNALDKVIGRYLASRPSAGRPGLGLTTGRITAEMVLKAARAGLEALASRGAASSRAVELAAKFNLTLISFLRGQQFNVLAGAEAFAAGSGLEETGPLSPAAGQTRILACDHGRLTWTQATLAEESKISLRLNDRPRARVMATPRQLDCLAAGFLFGEGLISSPESLAAIEVRGEEVAVKLQPALRAGAAAQASSRPGPGRLSPAGPRRPALDAQYILALMDDFAGQSAFFRQTGAVHSCCLVDGPRRYFVDDLARHNALDKVIGQSFLTGLPNGSGLLLTTGRISTEILIKSAKAGLGLIISRGAPTDRAVELAGRLGLTLVGFCRRDRFNVYQGADLFLRN